jgi:ribosome biogenesis protein MAK21
MERPEREETLLSLLINKLGDPNNEIPKHTTTNIVRVLKKHNNMTQVVTGEIQQYIQNVKTPAIYFYISLLNKIVFFEDDIDYITYVLKLYFSQFKRLNTERNENHKNEILTLILRGINSIATNLDPTTLESTFNSVADEVTHLFRLTNSNSFKVKIEALKLIFLFIKVDESLTDRFYKTLYKIVGSLKNVSALKLDSTFALLYKAIKRDR